MFKTCAEGYREIKCKEEKLGKKKTVREKKKQGNIVKPKFLAVSLLSVLTCSTTNYLETIIKVN